MNVFLSFTMRSQPTIPRDAKADWTVRFEYDEDDFEASSTSLPVNISSKLLTKTRNIWLTARLKTAKGDRIGEAHAGIIKQLVFHSYHSDYRFIF